MTKRKGGPKESRPTVCVGCGGAAAGYNYEAPSCYSCKTFFRRTVMEQKVHATCLKNGFCAREGATSQCRACRFLKCVRGGMNPRSITNLADPAANAVMRRFFSNSAVRDGVARDLQSPCASDPPFQQHSDLQPQHVSPIVSNPARLECKLEKMMLDVLALEDAHYRLRISTYCPVLVAGLRLDDFAPGLSRLGGKMEPMLSEAYEPVSIQLLPEEIMMKRRMTMDLTRFDFTKRKVWVFQDNIYTMEFIKALPVYALLDDCSKKVLLASALSCTNFTNAFFSYSKNSDRTCYPDGGTMSWNSEMQDSCPDSTRFHTALIAAIREAQLDKREYALLKMMIVCNPMLSGLSTHGVTLLQHEKECYTKILFSYVLARRGVKEGPALLAKLFSIIDLEMRLTSWVKSQHILIMAMGLYKYPMQLAEAFFHSH